MNIIERYQKSFIASAELPAITDLASNRTHNYLQLAAKIDEYHKLYKELGIQKGDKIALIGRNSINWIEAYMSVITYGAIVVPILADFNPNDVVNIVNHSDSRILFADKAILDKLDTNKLESIEKIFDIDGADEPKTDGFDIEKINYSATQEDDCLIISYTSGTTGISKGVMIPERSIRHNVEYSLTKGFHFKESRALSLLPLAHAYGCSIDMLTPLSTGAHMFVLGKMPTPSVLMNALTTVRPHVLCAVPLIIEKMVRKSVLPKLSGFPIGLIASIPLLNKILYRKAGKQMMAAFGGCIKEIIMGGAALAPDVEKFLRRAKVPFTVGYGMTECGPLICYASWDTFKSGSCGRALDEMEIRIDKEGYENGMGEICVRGTNVMLGYYKNPDATGRTLKDGWMHTGDIGFVDKAGNLYIRGRSKNMILTSAGQNIYPEEIESKLNALQGVGESLVYEQKGRLIALVVPTPEILKACNGNYEKIQEQMDLNLKILNTLVAPYEKVGEIHICAEAFEKTPKQSIKRFLYPTKAKIIEIMRKK